MKHYLFSLVGGLFVSVQVVAGDCPLVGTWMSDEAKTIASMNSDGKVTDKQREVLEKGFFGNLTIKINCTEYTSIYEGHEETIKYKLISANGNKITAEYYDELQGENVERTVTLEDGGECYSVPIEKLGFKEYFCKVK